MTLAKLASLFTHLGRAMEHFPQAPWHDALAHGQMQSKAWAADELSQLYRHLGMVYIVGGWLGTLAPFLYAANLPITKLRSFDIDPSCEAVADQLNIDHVIDDWHYKAVTKDMFAIDYSEHRYQIQTSQMTECPDTIINTSCDHVADFATWWSLIPSGKLVLLQNNDFQDGGDDHVNTVDSIDDMLRQAPMSELLYCGERSFAPAPYRRFMVIGLR